MTESLSSFSGPSCPSISSPCYATARTRRSNNARSTRPRTAISTLAGLESQQIICAVSESRGISPTVGLAFVNVDTCEVVMCQICDTQTYVRTIHKLIVLVPSEVLLVSSAASPKSKLFSIIEENVHDLDCAITLLDRRYWAEASGLEYIAELALSDQVDALNVAIAGNYFAVCCVAAALRYTEQALNKTFALHSVRFRYEPSEGAMMIDISTIRSLELIQNLQDARSKHCLLGLLNLTQTPMGTRLLRSSILQPLTDKDTLTTRYEALEELSTKEIAFFGVRNALKEFVDLDRVLTAVRCNEIPLLVLINMLQLVVVPVKDDMSVIEQSVNNIIMLRQAIVSVRPIFEALEDCASLLLAEIRELCAPRHIHRIQDAIDTVINEDVKYSRNPIDLRNQRTFAIKAGVNSLLDVSRTTFKENSEDISTYVAELARQCDLKLELKYDSPRQYYIRFHESELRDRQIPPVLINVTRRRDVVECSTMDLVKRNQKVIDSHNECILLSNDTVQALTEEVRAYIPGMFKICEGIAMLDMLSAFAQLSTTQAYVRPMLSDTMAIKACRHPIKEKIQRTKYVPNDVYATQQTRFQIITGCNMSGKSTYIRSIALVAVMAQIGCFVPAEFASFSIRHQIFARVSVDDDNGTNISSFASEMRETAFILQNIDKRSLAIIDELGRGTSTRDGLAIAIAIAEALIDSRALVWFVTHFVELSKIFSARSGVINLHLEVDMSDPDAMVMLYKVASGTVEDEHYGLTLARTLPLPPFVLEHATEVTATLKETMESQRQNSATVITTKRRKLILGLKEHLIQAHQGKLKGEALRQWLKELQRVFVERMGALELKEQRDGSPDMQCDENLELQHHEGVETRACSSGSSDILRTP